MALPYGPRVRSHAAAVRRLQSDVGRRVATDQWRRLAAEAIVDLSLEGRSGWAVLLPTWLDPIVDRVAADPAGPPRRARTSSV